MSVLNLFLRGHRAPGAPRTFHPHPLSFPLRLVAADPVAGSRVPAERRERDAGGGEPREPRRHVQDANRSSGAAAAAGCQHTAQTGGNVGSQLTWAAGGGVPGSPSLSFKRSGKDFFLAKLRPREKVLDETAG